MEDFGITYVRFLCCRPRPLQQLPTPATSPGTTEPSHAPPQSVPIHDAVTTVPTHATRHPHLRHPGSHLQHVRRLLHARLLAQEAQEGEETEDRGTGHGEEEKPGGLHDVPLGVPAEAPAGQGVLPQVHQMDQQGEGCLQAGRLQGGVQAVGHAQEQAGHELRDHGEGTEVLLPARHPGQGGRPAAGVPVRGGPQGYSRNRLYRSRVNWP